MLASVYRNSSLFQHRVFPVSHTNVEAPPPNEAQRGNHHVRANGESCNVRGETSQAADVRAIGWLEEKSQRTLWEERSLLLGRRRSVSFAYISHLFLSSDDIHVFHKVCARHIRPSRLPSTYEKVHLATCGLTYINREQTEQTVQNGVSRVE